MSTKAVTFLLLLSVASGCGRDSSADESLPPATGPGAPARAPLPDVTAPESKDAPPVAPSDRTTGTTEPIDRAEVAPSMSAIIQSIEVEEGDLVKKGQILFRLRTSDLSLRVDQARAAQKTAEVASSSAKIELDRMQRLLDKNAVERAQYDRVKAQYDAAQSGADQAKVAVSLARRGLGDATVHAPISGVVTKVPKNPGEMATMMPPTVVVVIEDQSKLKLKFRMPESSLATLQEGDKVKANLESMGEVREATISWVAPTVDPRSRTVEYQAILDNADRRLKSGMLAVVTIGETGEPAPPTDSGKPTDAVVEPAK